MVSLVHGPWRHVTSRWSACIIPTGYDRRWILDMLKIVKWTNWQSSTVVRRRERFVSPSHVHKTQLNPTGSWVAMPAYVGWLADWSGWKAAYSLLCDVRRVGTNRSMGLCWWYSSSISSNSTVPSHRVIVVLIIVQFVPSESWSRTIRVETTCPLGYGCVRTCRRTPSNLVIDTISNHSFIIIMVVILR